MGHTRKKTTILRKRGLFMAENRWYRHVVRVRYEETDQMGVVYHANYLNWFEIGRTELIREMGMPYKEIEARGLLLPVVELDVKYRLPARYDDLIAIYTRVVDFTYVRLEFAYEIRRHEPAPEAGEPGGPPAADEPNKRAVAPSPSGIVPAGELLVSGTTRHVWTDRSFKPARLDKKAPDVYELLEKG